jgi:hypothetical protein
MSVQELLRDPNVVVSVALEACTKLFGPGVLVWEPDTIRIELSRKNIEPTASLMSKILGGITILTTNTWTYDHDVLFAFALTCSGIPAASDAFHHPTPEQLCWAVDEISVIHEKEITDDEGFDPDTIDPAIAAILHDEGYLVAPDELSFAQDKLDKMNVGADPEQVRQLKALWKQMPSDTSEVRKILMEQGENFATVQITRLLNCREYVTQHKLLRQVQRGLVTRG